MSILKKILLSVTILGSAFLFLGQVAPTYPQWWLDQGVAESQPVGPGDPGYDPNNVEHVEAWNEWLRGNSSPANVGQLKHIATEAKKHVDLYLSPSAQEWDDAYTHLVDGQYVNFNPFPFQSNVGDYSVVNIGQLKAVADGIYAILENNGFDIDGHLASQSQGGVWTENRPWTATTADDDNSAVANLGQLKFVFSFDLSGEVNVDSESSGSGDGMDDSWEQQIVDFDPADDILTIDDVLPGADFDGDYLDNITEFLRGTNPTEADIPFPALPDDPANWRGYVLLDHWSSGVLAETLDAVSLPAFPGLPDKRRVIDSLQIENFSGAGTANVIRGYIHAPKSGRYTFFLSGTSDAELLLSSNSNPASVHTFIELDGVTDQSKAKEGICEFESGNKYYFEIRQVSGASGGGSVELAWEYEDVSRHVVPLSALSLPPYLPTVDSGGAVLAFINELPYEPSVRVYSGISIGSIVEQVPDSYQWTLESASDGQDLEDVTIDDPIALSPSFNATEAGTFGFALAVTYDSIADQSGSMPYIASDALEFTVIDINPTLFSLVSHWRFDEGNLLTVDDHGASGIDLDIYNANYTDGIGAEAIHFANPLNDGGRKLKAEYNDALAITGELTLSLWVKFEEGTTDLSRYERLISSKSQWNALGGYEIEYNPLQNRLTFGGNSSEQYVVRGVALEDGSWHHIAFTLEWDNVLDGYEPTFYVNGQKLLGGNVWLGGEPGGGIVGSGLMSGLAASPHSLTLGDFPSGSVSGLWGALDEVRVYDAALSAETIELLFLERGGLLFHANALEGVELSGGTSRVSAWYDVSGRGNAFNASLSDQMPLYVEENGVLRLRFDGVNDALTFSPASGDGTFGYNGDFTVALTTAIGGYGSYGEQVFDSHPGTGDLGGWKLIRDQESNYLSILPDSGEDDQIDGLLEGGLGQVLIITSELDEVASTRTVSIFQDGMLVSESVFDASENVISFLADDMVLGASDGELEPTPFDIFDFRVYSRALTNKEINRLNYKLFEQYLREQTVTLRLASPRRPLSLVGASAEIVLDAVLDIGSAHVDKVAFYSAGRFGDQENPENHTALGEVSSAPYRIIDYEIFPGSYYVYAVAYRGNRVIARTRPIAITLEDFQQGGYEIVQLEGGDMAYGISDTTVDELPFVSGTGSGYPMVWSLDVPFGKRLLVDGGEYYGEARAININGHAAGWARDGTGLQRAVEWRYENAEWAGRWLSGNASMLTDISDNDVSVGYYDISPDFSRAFYAHLGGALEEYDIWKENPGLNRAWGISDSGEVVVGQHNVERWRISPDLDERRRVLVVDWHPEADYRPFEFEGYFRMAADWPTLPTLPWYWPNSSYIASTKADDPWSHNGRAIDVVKNEEESFWVGESRFWYYLGYKIGWRNHIPSISGMWYLARPKLAAFGNFEALGERDWQGDDDDLNAPILLVSNGIAALGGFGSEALSAEIIDGHLNIVGSSYTRAGSPFLEITSLIGVAVDDSFDKDTDLDFDFPFEFKRNEKHAFLYRYELGTPDTTSIVDLNDLVGSDWELTVAHDINNNGIIVGGGFYRGRPAAFMMGATTDSDGDKLSDYTEGFYTGGLINNTNSDLVDESAYPNYPLDDLIEALYGTNARSADTDSDDLPDNWEIKYGLDPLDDGTNNPFDQQSNPDFGKEGDPDRDGLTNYEELVSNTDPRYPDTDGDGMPDGWEMLYAFDPLDWADGGTDFDGDGLLNVEEYQYAANPTKVNSDIEIDIENMQPLRVSAGSESIPVNIPGKWQEVFDYENGRPFLDPATKDFDAYPLGYIPYRHADFSQNEVIFGEDGYPVPDAAINPGFYYLDPLTAAPFLNIDNSSKQFPEEYFDVFHFDYLDYVYPSYYLRPYDALDVAVDIVEQVELELFGEPVTDGQGNAITLSRYKFVPNVGELVWDLDSAGFITDENGILDGLEVRMGWDPNGTFDSLWDAVRLPGVTIWDYYQLGNSFSDSDNDLVPDALEGTLYSGLHSTRSDSEGQSGDGMFDGYELAHKLDPTTDDSADDLDNDGLSNITEFNAGLLPNYYDTDADGLPDAYELGINPAHPVPLNPISGMNGLVVWYTFDDFDKNRVYDRSLLTSSVQSEIHRFNDAFMIGEASIKELNIFDVEYSSSLSLGDEESSMDDIGYLTVPDDDDLELNEVGFTIAFWLNWTEPGSYENLSGECTIFNKAGSYKGTINPWEQTLTFTAACLDTGGLPTDDLTATIFGIEPGVWHHVEIIYDQSDLTLRVLREDKPAGYHYVEGEQPGLVELAHRPMIPADTGISFIDNDRPFHIGALRTVPITALGMKIDDWRTYDRALSISELDVIADPAHPSRDGYKDRDDDGSNEYQEYVNHTNPDKIDSDGDTIPDGVEIAGYKIDGGVIIPAPLGVELPVGYYTSHPKWDDSDGDGLTDYQEVAGQTVTIAIVGQTPIDVFVITDPMKSDSDYISGEVGEFDGLSDGFEVANGLNPLSVDTDGDGIDDGFETFMDGLNPKDPSDATGNLDGDSQDNYTEYLDPTRFVGIDDEPLAPYQNGDPGNGSGDPGNGGGNPGSGGGSLVDTDNDGMPDEWEVHYGFDPDDYLDPANDTFAADDFDADPDGDGYTNLDEYKNGTNPLTGENQLNVRNILRMYDCEHGGVDHAEVDHRIYYPVTYDYVKDPVTGVVEAEVQSDAPWDVWLMGGAETRGYFANAGMVRVTGLLRTDIEDFEVNENFTQLIHDEDNNRTLLVWEFPGNQGNPFDIVNYTLTDPLSFHSEEEPFYHQPILATEFINSLAREEGTGMVEYEIVYYGTQLCGNLDEPWGKFYLPEKHSIGKTGSELDAVPVVDGGEATPSEIDDTKEPTEPASTFDKNYGPGAWGEDFQILAFTSAFMTPTNVALSVNSGDIDGDGVPNFADGLSNKFESHGVHPTLEEPFVESADFYPLKLVLPDEFSSTSGIKLRIVYDASDPNAMSATANGSGGYDYELPSDGTIRIWTQNGDALRSASTITDNSSGAHFVPSGKYVDLDQLGFVADSDTGVISTTLYVEAVKFGAFLEPTFLYISYADESIDEVVDNTPPVVEYVQGFSFQWVDIDIDSDNTNGLDSPDESYAEELVEDPNKLTGFNAENPDISKVGKIVYANNGDIDSDFVPDYADGMSDMFELDGVRYPEELGILESASFTPVSVRLPDPGVVGNYKVKFTYNASDPLVATASLDSDDNDVYTPASGTMRLWLEDNTVIRSANSAVSELGGSTGDFIPSDVYLSPDSIGAPGGAQITVYLEAVASSEEVAGETITLSLYPDDGSLDDDSSPVFSDTIATTNLRRFIAQPKEDGSGLEETRRITLSQPVPRIELDYVQINSIGVSADDKSIIGQLKIKGTILSDLCDIRYGDAGIIDTAEVYLNGGESPVAIIDINDYEKDVDEENYRRPYPYSGPINDFITGDLELLEGVNLVTILVKDPGEDGLWGHADATVTVSAELTTTEYVNSSELTVEFPSGLDDTVIDTVNASLWLEGGTTLSYTLVETGIATNVFTTDQVDQYGDPIPFVQLDCLPDPDLGSVSQFTATLDDQITGIISIHSVSNSVSDLDIFTGVIQREVEIWEYPDYDGFTISSGEELLIPQGDDRVFHPFTEIHEGPGALLEQLKAELATPTEDGFDTVVYVMNPVDSFAIDMAMGPAGLDRPNDNYWQLSESSAPEVWLALSFGWSKPTVDLENLVQGDPLGDIPPVLQEAVAKMSPEDAAVFGVLYGFGNGGWTTVTDIHEIAVNLTSFAIINSNDGRTVLRLFYDDEVVEIMHEQSIQAMSATLESAGNFVKAFGQIVIKLQADRNAYVLAVLTGDDEEVGELVAEYTEYVEKAIGIMDSIAEQYDSYSTFGKSFIVGKFAFEIVSMVVPPAKLSKVKFIERLCKRPGLKDWVGEWPSTSADSWVDGIPSTDELKKLKPLGVKLATNAGELATTKMCFVAGTPVLTPHGYQAIQTVQPGDFVLSRDPETGVMADKVVLDTIITHPERLYHITIQSGSGDDGDDAWSSEQTLVCTGEHPFWIESVAEFIPADELTIGDSVLLHNGSNATIVSIQIENAPLGETFTTYNFEVADFHTYFAGEPGVWVHNMTLRSCQEAFEVMSELLYKHNNDVIKAYDEFKALATSSAVRNLPVELRTFNEVRKSYFIFGSNIKPTWRRNIQDQKISHTNYSARKLGQNLEISGVTRPPYTTPHHIVAHGDYRYPECDQIRQILGKGDKVKVHLDEAANGVFLPNTKAPQGYAAVLGPVRHNGSHPRKYYQDVLAELESLGPDPTADEIRDKLQEIAVKIIDGDIKIHN
ncbi:LamG-like jellyroll fold domain-containing protein [Cerasicoccus fimbriatus]|uniref:LamG-like jellyroll fold domain-containing protein n=1 Tax=Cerasicoccus fimbriatus TaxID=3014554 RepID=UPI0022B3ADC1|nr:LamG-like jellyroll fold domain-containing protein [Cerasicoccus sp. TK19100]